MQFPASLAVIEMGFHGGAWVPVWYLMVLRKTYVVVRKDGGIFGSIVIPNLVPSNQSNERLGTRQCYSIMFTKPFFNHHTIVELKTKTVLEVL